MGVHPNSIRSAYHEFSQGNGGLECPLNAGDVADIIAEVHAVAKKHQRNREIQFRIRKAVLSRYPTYFWGSSLALPASAIEGGTEP